MDKIINLTVIGGGNLGVQIAFQSAIKKVNVIVYDIDFEAFSKAMELFPKLKGMYIKHQNIAPDLLDEALNNIVFSTNLAEAVADADMIIEAVPENVEIKKELYTSLATLAPKKTIFATNSSTFLPSSLMLFTGRPDRFLALHFANALFRFNIAEVMGTPKTDPEVYATTVNFAKEIGMIPIEIKKEKAGYILNTLLIPLLTAAAELFMRGVGDIETIDKTWRISTGAPAGPFEILDVIGLNTMYNIACTKDDISSKFFAHYLKENFINKGKLGYFSGEGFYKYE
ncbi:MAG: hypothetical protein RL662_147 [Bacteroidota bacterium]|jgi:3-hydroxybutyryl-CoA dehydrogenase